MGIRQGVVLVAAQFTQALEIDAGWHIQRAHGESWGVGIAEGGEGTVGGAEEAGSRTLARFAGNGHGGRDARLLGELFFDYGRPGRMKDDWVGRIAAAEH